MSKQDTALIAWDGECKLAIANAKELADTSIEPDSDKFKRNVLDNIPQHFGEFLYTALGDRVTGQRSSVLNREFIKNNSLLVEEAKEQGITVEKFLSDKAINDKNMVYGVDQHQAFITAGRKFGVSYFTGSGARVHTIYFGAKHAFKYLTQDHVDCVKNKKKKECTQAFLDFRDNFIGGLDGLNNSLDETPIDVKLGVVSLVNKTSKICRDTYNSSNTGRYTLLDDVIDSTITHTITSIQEYPIWNMRDRLRSGEVKSIYGDIPSYISLTFLNIKQDDTISVVGNVDFSVRSSKHSLEFASNDNVRTVVNHLDYINSYHRITDHAAVRDSGHSKLHTRDSGGVLMNMDDVVKNPAVRAIIDKRVDYYAKHSTLLQELKHEYADLYFVNADI